MEDLDARLRQVPANNSFSLPSETEEDERPDLVDIEFLRTKYEIESYHELIKDGGRPIYPIDLVRDVLRNPDNYAEILRPWQESLDQIRPDDVLERQWDRWQDFRKWQNNNRGREDDDGGFLAYIERRKYEIRRDILPKPAAKRLAQIEADPSCLEPRWEELQCERERHRYRYRERGCNGFSDYAEAVRRRLARHDFTRPFQLHEDPKQQDKLTTWIEYLNYEYWWLDKYTGDIERLQPSHDKAWQELVDEKVLRSHETEAFILTDASPMERQAEDDEAMKDMERLRVEAQRIYRLTQEDPLRLSIPRAKRVLMMQNASTKLQAAKRRFQQVKSRNDRVCDFVRGTLGHAGAKRNAALQRILRLPWVLEQIPLIDDEQSQSPTSEAESGEIKTTKRRRAAEGDEEENTNPKRQRLHHHGSGPPLSSSSLRVPSQAKSEPLAVKDQGAAQGDDDEGDARAVFRGPRRSARLATRRDVSRQTL